MKHSLIALTLAYTAGIVLGHGFLYFPCAVSVLAGLVLLVLGLLVILRKLACRRFLLFAVSCFIGMSAYLYSATWLPSDHYVRIFLPDNRLHAITGTISSSLDRDIDRTSCVLDVFEIDGVKVSGKARMTVRNAQGIGYDDVVRVSGKLYQPRGFDNPGGFDYPAYLARNGISRALSVRNGDRVHVLAPGRGVFRRIQDWRERIRQAFLASTSGPGSAILQAMVLGEEGGLTDEMRDLFQAAGVTHIISISGSHLGMVALVCFGLIRLLMRILPGLTYLRLTLYADPKKIAAWITLPLVIFYTLLAGGQTATVRSLVMIVAGLSALILDRESALMHSLCIAALLILVASPQALFDVSFQLSFISVLSIGYIVVLWKDLQLRPAGRLKKLCSDAVLLVLISFGTGLASGPLVVHYFNQLSLAGIVSNLIVIPFAGMIVVPLGLASGIWSLFTLHLPLAAVNQAAADAFIRTVTFFARLPFAEFHPPSPGLAWLLCYSVFIACLFALIRARLLSALKPFEYSRRASRTHRAALVLSFLFLIIGPASDLVKPEKTVVSIPDVGQGDCALIQVPGGKNILVDAGGTYDDRFDIGRRIVAPFLWDRGVHRLDLVVLSHPHPDHMNGLKYILRNFDVREVWTHGRDRDLPGYAEFASALVHKKLKHTIVSLNSPSSFRVGTACLRVLHPASGFRSPQRKHYAAENDSSLELRVSVSNRVLLFAGDVGASAEQAMFGSGCGLRCDLLKVPHHGSRSSSSEEFVAAVRPAVALIPVGKGNAYRHPSPEVLERYEAAGSRVYRTDRDGAIFITLHEQELEATTWNGQKLKQVFPAEQMLDGERQNWKLLWLRKWEL